MLIKRFRWPAVAVTLGLAIPAMPASPASAAAAPAPLTVVVDDKLHGDLASVPDPAGDATVPVSAVAGPGTATGMFVPGDVIVHGSLDVARSLADQLNGRILLTLDPSTAGVAGLAPYYLVRFDPATADTGSVVQDLSGVNPDAAYGEYRISDRGGLGTVAVAAHALAAGTQVDLDWVATDQTFRTNSTVEAPGSLSNAFAWSSLTTIGVPAAWNLLARAGRFAPGSFRPAIAIADDGFSTADPDRAPGGNTPSTAPNTVGCGGSACPRHGSDVASLAFAVPDNSFGSAGPAGPVATPFMFPAGATTSSIMSAYLAASGSRARVVNSSFGGSVPSLLTSTLNGFDSLVATLNATGIMEFAAAGNAGLDVDALTCIVGCFETDLFFPCENTGVICVGGLSGTVPATSSNFGTGGLASDGTVDIWTPFCGLAGPNDNQPGNAVHSFCGTSAATPLASGVGGLLSAASGGAPGSLLQAILSATATSGGCLPNGACARRIANARAGVAALFGNLPPDLTISATSATTAARGTPISFTSTATDPEGAPLTVTWFVDGAVFATGTTASNTFLSLPFGQHLVTSTVQDGTWPAVPDAAGGIAITVTNTAPVMTITSPADGASYLAGPVTNPPILGFSLCRIYYRQGLPCPYVIDLQATSVDVNNQPTSLPDANVTWLLDGTALGGTGHHLTLYTTGMAVGQHTITVRGTDGALVGQTSVGINVTN